MKKVLTLLTFVFVVTTLLNAQTTLENNIVKHVKILSSDEMQGRAEGSAQIQDAANYIKQQLNEVGLKVYDFPIKGDSLKPYSDSLSLGVTGKIEINNTYTAFYTIINAPNNNTKYTLLSTYFSGYGVDTIKQCLLIKNSANVGASGTATLIELAKYFKTNQDKLKKNIIIFFTEYGDMGIQDYYLSKYFNEGNIDMAINIRDVGYLGTDEDEGQYYYNVSSDIKDASKILQPILLRDVDLPTSADYNNVFVFPMIDVGSEIYLPIYEDIADSLNYSMMASLTTQLEKVILAFNNADVEIDTTTINKTESNSYSSLFGKNTSYFGINLMIGSNTHYYTEGRMTGKSAMSYSAGLFYKWQFSNMWAMKLDANYERAYANRNDGRYKSNVLSVPLSIMYAVGYDDFEFLCGVGPYYDYTLSAKLAGESVSWDDFNRSEWGWQWSLSIRFMNCILGYYQKIGISNMMTNDFPLDGKIENRNRYFFIGITF